MVKKCVGKLIENGGRTETMMTHNLFVSCCFLFLGNGLNNRGKLVSYTTVYCDVVGASVVFVLAKLLDF